MVAADSGGGGCSDKRDRKKKKTKQGDYHGGCDGGATG